MTITKDTILGDILDAAPETAPLFIEIGMHCLGCPSARSETVEQACMVHESKLLQPPVLDARVAAAAAYVRPGCVAADVGCDHGRLSVALAAQGKCRKIIASDIRPAPLATAQRLVTLHGCGDVVECRLGAGLSVLRPGEADDIVIAGVSGVTVCEMLEQPPEAFYAAKPDMRFIFIPATKHPFLRRWLAQHGFALLDETPVLAAGRYYTVMHAAYTGGTKTPDPLWCVVGRAGRGPHAAGYLAREAMLLKKEARGAAPEESKRLLALAAAVEEAANTCQA